MLLANIFLQFIQLIVGEFDDLAALEAEEMIVAGTTEGFFVPRVRAAETFP
jgi:hypothetical protein